MQGDEPRTPGRHFSEDSPSDMDDLHKNRGVIWDKIDILLKHRLKWEDE